VRRTLTQLEVRQVYGRLAASYDRFAKLSESRARRRVLELANLRDGDEVLEVAVGTGLLFVEILKRNPNGRNEGIDLTDAMLEQARAKVTGSGALRWQLRRGDAYALDYPDASFDVLANCYMFDLLPEADFEPVLGEFHRVLRPNGRLVLANMTPTHHLAYRLWDLLHRTNPAWVGGCRGVQLSDPLIRAGFRVEARELVTQLAVTSEVIRAVKA
jgi:demethylmenaquinone methyltransferase / 2-methoxy-6-polyprenyl-1,4-benzoquinol methylase